MTEIERPEWLVPGAEVIVWRLMHGRLDVQRTRVAKVAKLSFTVEGSSLRFSIRLMASTASSHWDQPHRVTPADSDEAAGILRRFNSQRRVDHAKVAVDKWARTQTEDKRLAAIAALQAIGEVATDE